MIYIVTVVLNLIALLALILVLTAVEEVENVEIDKRIKAGAIILAVIISLIPYFNFMSLLTWGVMILAGIAIYFEDM